MSYSILHDLVIKVPTKRVFDAVTLPGELNKWWTLKCSGQPELGATYNLHFTEKYDWYGEVSACEPGTRFHINMTQTDPDWMGTSFGFDLKAVDSGTRVTLSHTGWRDSGEHFRHTSYCWALLLKGLKNYLEKGIVLPFEERD